MIMIILIESYLRKVLILSSTDLAIPRLFSLLFHKVPGHSSTLFLMLITLSSVHTTIRTTEKQRNTIIISYSLYNLHKTPTLIALKPFEVLNYIENNKYNATQYNLYTSKTEYNFYLVAFL